MLPHRPRVLDSDFAADPARSSTSPTAAEPIDHVCQICPTCSARLSGHRCKLVCTQCGYYMSCADYY